jgi:hypothetical protein
MEVCRQLSLHYGRHELRQLLLCVHQLLLCGDCRCETRRVLLSGHVLYLAEALL